MSSQLQCTDTDEPIFVSTQKTAIFMNKSVSVSYYRKWKTTGCNYQVSNAMRHAALLCLLVLFHVLPLFD
jgi:hypothetical protein